MGVDWPLWVLVELTEMQFLTGLELEMEESGYWMGKSGKIAKD